MTLTATLTAALFSFLRKRYMMAYIACGIAFLAKAPIGFGLGTFIAFFRLLVQTKVFRHQPGAHAPSSALWELPPPAFSANS